MSFNRIIKIYLMRTMPSYPRHLLYTIFTSQEIFSAAGRLTLVKTLNGCYYLLPGKVKVLLCLVSSVRRETKGRTQAQPPEPAVRFWGVPASHKTGICFDKLFVKSR